jgi:hypothetical protein
MSLPAQWVDRIFAKMAVTYGNAWVRMWEGVDVDAVKADWASSLGFYFGRPSAIAWGLEHLPADKPPTVLQFRELCRSMPDEPPKRIETSKAADPAKVAEAMKRLRKSSVQRTSAREWAYALKARDEAGERLSILQREMYRDALRGDIAIAVDEDELQEARAA